MWDVGDPMLGSGGSLWGFGYDPIGGYAFAVTNQADRAGSFYNPQMFDTVIVDNQYVPDPEVVDTQHASNVAYVTGLYRQLFNREPDQAGLEYWVNRIEQGLNDRASVDFAFRDSIEYKQLHPQSPAPPTSVVTTIAPIVQPASSGNAWLLPLLIVGAVLVFSGK